MPDSRQRTTRARRRGYVLGVSAFLFAFAVTSCSDAGRTPGPDGAVATGELRGAQTLPQPSAVAPSTTAALRLGFDCTAVHAAEARLDRAIETTLDRWGISANSPQGFDATMVVTSVNSGGFWRQALAVLPSDLREQGARVLRHWAALQVGVAASGRELGLEPAPFGSTGGSTTGTPPSPTGTSGASATTGTTRASGAPSATRLHAVRSAVEDLARRHGGATVADDERTIRARMSRACPNV